MERKTYFNKTYLPLLYNQLLVFYLLEYLVQLALPMYIIRLRSLHIIGLSNINSSFYCNLKMEYFN